jgi:hypothetical protein
VNDRRFGVVVLATAIGLSPLILFAWIWLVATVDFGDVLSLLCVLVVQYELRKFRQEERATYRAMRRERARQSYAEPSSRSTVRVDFDNDARNGPPRRVPRFQAWQSSAQDR